MCGGEEGNPDETDDALMWNDGIQKYINEGVEIIAGIGGYMAHRNEANNQPQPDLRRALEVKAEIERQQLEKSARKATLTIYLMNDGVINGPVANNN